MTLRSKWSQIIWLPVVAAVVLLIYLPGINHPPLYDDTLLDEEVFVHYGSLWQWRVRMLSYGTFVWIHELFGAGVWKQRVANLAIHLGVVLALWSFYRELLRYVEAPTGDAGAGEAPVAFHQSPALPLAIGFFAINPVAVYAVAYLIQRSILLATLFVVLALWLFAVGIGRKRPACHVISLACYGLAVASKEHAILAPLAALPVYVIVARPSARRLASIAVAGAVLTAVAGALLWPRYGRIIGQAFDEYSHVYLAQLDALRPGAGDQAYALSVVNQAYLFFQYGLRWLFPASGWMSINLRPPFPLEVLSFPHALAAIGYAATVAGSFWLLLRHRDWRALLGLSLLVPALLFATEFATVWVQDPFVLYRSYLWAIGIPGVVLLLLHGAPGRVLAGIAVVVGALLVWQSFDRVVSLSTAERAWTDAIRKLPDDPRSVGRWFPYLNRGTEYVEANQFTLAMRDFEASSALGDLGMGAFNQGALLAAAGKHQQALAAFDQAQKQGYDLYNLPFQRALSLLALNRHAEAYEQLRLARAKNPPSPTRELALMHLGRTALQIGERQEAMTALKQLLAMQPRHTEGRFLLAMAHNSNGDYALALALADGLVREAGTGLAYYARAIAHQGLGHKAAALADIQQARRLGPDNQNLRDWQAKIEAMP